MNLGGLRPPNPTGQRPQGLPKPIFKYRGANALTRNLRRPNHLRLLDNLGHARRHLGIGDGTDGVGDDDRLKTLVRNCNTKESKLSRTTDVGSYPGGASPWGCEDMAGNVWDWTGSWWDEAGNARVVRGGCWFGSLHVARCACRSDVEPASHYNYLGFRCART